MNVGKSKVMRCARYGNGGQIHMILNGEPLEEADYFKGILHKKKFFIIYLGEKQFEHKIIMSEFSSF